MKLLIKDMVSLLDDKLTLRARGILITIMLLKDSDSKVWLAKCKSKINFREASLELAILHKREYISWSGFKAYEKGVKSRVVNPDIEEVLSFMNKLYGRKFKSSSSETTKGIRGRLEDHTVADLKLVVANRYTVWKDDPVSEKWLNPFTIFRPSKFEKYIEEAKRTKEGTSFLTVEALGLENGDEITIDNVKSFVDNDTYNIVTYRVDDEGRRRSSGLSGVRYGRDIKITLRVQANNMKFGEPREFIYTYKTK